MSIAPESLGGLKPEMRERRILILTVPHGASHDRTAGALKKALAEIQPDLTVRVENALDRCARWFRFYYDSYKIPLKYWPGLWEWVEGLQHRSNSTGPAWLYRQGGKKLFRFIEEFDPDVVVATEVGLCELAALLKRERGARFRLVATPTESNFDQAWAQPEVDLYTVSPDGAQAQLKAAGVFPEKILACGMPVDPAFESLPDRADARARLGARADAPLVLVLFGGCGTARPRPVLTELEKISLPLQVVLIAGKNRQLEERLAHFVAASRGSPKFRAFGWVDNIHEWMAAADLLVSKPGATTVSEAINAALPILAFDPLPGNELRTCAQIEEWGVGTWVKRRRDLAANIERLCTNRGEVQRMRACAQALARPSAVKDAARAVLKLLDQRA
jgi:processive 1,2-diacylglycerol beta-glucosyltransferase